MFPYPGCVTTIKRKKSCQPCTVMMRPVKRSTSSSSTSTKRSTSTAARMPRKKVRSITVRSVATRPTPRLKALKKPSTCLVKKVTKGTVGSRAEVMHGTKNRTSGALGKSHLKYKNGRIVSKCKSDAAKMRWKKQMQDPAFRKKWMMFTKRK